MLKRVITENRMKRLPFWKKIRKYEGSKSNGGFDTERTRHGAVETGTH